MGGLVHVSPLEGDDFAGPHAGDAGDPGQCLAVMPRHPLGRPVFQLLGGPQ